MQPALFEDLRLPKPDVLMVPNFLADHEQRQLFEHCKTQVAWEQRSVVYFDKVLAIPRLLAWFGEVTYSYAGVRHTATNFPPELLELKGQVEAELALLGVQAVFNSVLLNYYRDGKDSISMHADDEPELGSQPVIASVSLGAPRTFNMVHVATKTKVSYWLTGGSLLVMKGDSQSAWRHGIPKEPSAGPRINLTFRYTAPAMA